MYFFYFNKKVEYRQESCFERGGIGLIHDTDQTQTSENVYMQGIDLFHR